MVHVRDTLTGPLDRRASDLMRPVLALQAHTPVYSALTTMRESRNHIAVVHDGDTFAGVVTLADVLTRLFPRTAATGQPPSADGTRREPAALEHLVAAPTSPVHLP